MNTPQNVARLLQELVQIPSVNPSDDPGTDQVGEERIAEYLSFFLKDLGAVVELREVEPGRPNVVARFPTDRAGKPRLLLAPHTDTVSIAGMAIEPFSGTLSDGKIWGRGASDTKGPMAAMLWALKQSGDLLPRLSHEIWFAGLVGEESGQHGAKALAAQERFDFVIAAEPTGLKIVHTHKGAIWLSLTTRGKAVHASQPERGCNAIYKMADVVRCIRDELSPALAELRHPALGSPTISAGVISGGSKTNIVPDVCHAEIDVRSIPGNENLFSQVTDALRKVCPDIEIESKVTKPMYTDPSHPLIKLLGECGGNPAGAPWFSDAAIFAHHGMPAIALGPGSIAQAHTCDEWISVDDLKDGVEFFRRFLERL